MEYCNGCNKEVEDPIRLDKHCNLPYCKDCIIKLENAHGEGKMYSEIYESADEEKCDRCQKMFYKRFLVKHTGRYTYDCVFCKSCIDFFNELIQELKNKS